MKKLTYLFKKLTKIENYIAFDPIYGLERKVSHFCS